MHEKRDGEDTSSAGDNKEDVLVFEIDVHRM